MLANSEDPDQTPRSAASDVGLHCLPMSQKWALSAIIKRMCSSIRYMNTCTALLYKPALKPRGRVLDFCAEGRGFVPQPGQKVISILSPVTFGAQRK